MAQVTMDGKEYLELIAKARKLEQIEQEMVKNVQIALDPESTYRKFNVSITPVFTDKARNSVISRVVDEIKDQQWLIDFLFEENRHFLNMKDGYISYNWDDKPEPWEVDLCTDKAFKAAWDAAAERAKKAEEIDQEFMEEDEE